MHKIILVSQPPTLPNVPAGLPLDGLVAFYGFDEGRNLLKYSQQFDNAAWTKSSTTVTPNAVVAPDGTLTADAIYEVAADIKHFIRQPMSMPYGNNTSSYYVKANGINRVCLRDGAATGFYVTFDLSAGAIVEKSAQVTGAIVAVGDGWYRVSHTMGWVAGEWYCALHLLNDDEQNEADSAHLGDITKGIYVWGAQIEVGSYATTYYPTTDKQILKDFANRSRNLLLPNQANAGEDGTIVGFTSTKSTITSSVEQAWQGSRSLKIVTSNTAVSEGFYCQVEGLTPGKAYTFSAYVKGSGSGYLRLRELTDAGVTGSFDISEIFTLSGEWTRYSATHIFTETGRACRIYFFTNIQQAATFYIDGLQLEEGSVATEWQAPPNHGILGSSLGADTNDPTWTGQGLLYGADDSVTFGPILDRSGAVANMGTMLMAFYTPATINAAATKLCSYSLGTGMAIYFGAVAGAPENNIVTVQYDGAGSYTSWCDAVAGIAAGWHTIALAWNGAAYDIWIDGDLKTTTSAGSPALLPLSNANCCYDGTTYGDGLIHAARGVWDRGLAPSEVARATRAIKAELAGAVVLP